jgi:hypothetical protein
LTAGLAASLRSGRSDFFSDGLSSKPFLLRPAKETVKIISIRFLVNPSAARTIVP